MFRVQYKIFLNTKVTEEVSPKSTDARWYYI